MPLALPLHIVYLHQKVAIGVPNHLQHHLCIHCHSHLLQSGGHMSPYSALISDLMFQLQIKPTNAENP